MRIRTLIAYFLPSSFLLPSDCPFTFLLCLVRICPLHPLLLFPFSHFLFPSIPIHSSQFLFLLLLLFFLFLLYYVLFLPFLLLLQIFSLLIPHSCYPYSCILHSSSSFCSFYFSYSSCPTSCSCLLLILLLLLLLFLLLFPHSQQARQSPPPQLRYSAKNNKKRLPSSRRRLWFADKWASVLGRLLRPLNHATQPLDNT